MSGTGTDVDRLAGEVAQVVAAIDRAKADTHGAAEAAKTTTMRAAASGYAAVAQQMHAVQQQLNQVAGVLDSAATEAKRAGSTVREVTDRMSPDQVAGRLTTAAERVTTMRGTLYSAVQQLANVSNNVSAALRGGQPGPLLGRIDAIRQIITIAAQRGDAAKSAIQGETASARSLGAPGKLTGPAAGSPGQPGTASPGTPGKPPPPESPAGPPGAAGASDDGDAGPPGDDIHPTLPTGERGGRPTGTPAHIYPDEDQRNKRDYRLENQGADILADRGYRVYQHPDLQQTAAARAAFGDVGRPTSEPDYLVEGRVWECYSPREGTNTRGVWRQSEKKVQSGQTQRLLVNLQEWDGDLGALRQQFATWPITHMKEVKAITPDRRIIDLWPPVRG